MLIDFSPLREDTTTLAEFTAQFNVQDLKAATNAYCDKLLEFVSDLTDAHLMFTPLDPEADDRAAADEADRHIAWNLAHLVLHVTASSEEGAAFGSMQARGVKLPEKIRLRYEPDWRDVTTKNQVLQRIEESRRIRLAYLDTFPDEPFLNNYRPFPEESPLHNAMNAITSVIFGLYHEDNHHDQIREVRRQAVEAVAGV